MSIQKKSSHYVVIDIGSNKISGIVALIDKKQGVRVLSQALYHSKGIKSGIVTNVRDLENSIMHVIYNLERDCARSIKNISISMSGVGTKSYFMYNTITIYNQQITKFDVKKLIEKSLLIFDKKDQDIIQYFPIEFSIDNNKYVEDPIGMYGNILGCHLHIVAADSAIIMNLVNCFSKCQIEINNIILAVYASGISCLTDDEKKLGSIIIDFGSETTSFAIFFANKLLYTGYVNLGGNHITYDIAKIFSIHFNAAERLKILYGSTILPSFFEKNNVINLDELELDSYINVSPITSYQLSEIIYSRAEEILIMLKDQYDKIGVDHLIARRIVLTGGGAALRGIRELTSQIFDKHVRIAKPLVIPGFIENCNPGIYSTAIGMVKDQIIQQDNNLLFTYGKENISFVKKILLWLNDNL